MIEEIKEELYYRIWEIGISDEERFNRDCAYGLFFRLFISKSRGFVLSIPEATKSFLNSGFKIPEHIKNKILLLSL